MRYFVLFTTLFALMTSTMATAEPEPPKVPEWTEAFPDRQGFIATARLGVNLLSVPSNTNYDNRISFLGGAGINYFFTPYAGAFADLHYTSRAFKSGAACNSASYMDIPFGLSFNLGGGLFSSNARSHTRLGGFYAIPLGDYSGDLTTPYNQDSQGFFGIYVGNEMHFPISDHFSLGYTLWVKIALGSTVKVGEHKVNEIGLGFVFGFL